jgi:hypothetical protein
MNTTMIVVAVCVVIVAIGAILLFQRNRRSSALKSRFGPEYEHELEAKGSRPKAEAELAERQKRVAAFGIHPLGAVDRDRYIGAWRRVQALFVDDPKAAATQADDLLGQVMATRGYPVADFDQRAADVSVDHPFVVENYRTAHEIALRHASGGASTEDLRQAMVHYRSLFDELVGETDKAALEAEPPRETAAEREPELQPAQGSAPR